MSIFDCVLQAHDGQYCKIESFFLHDYRSMWSTAPVNKYFYCSLEAIFDI